MLTETEEVQESQVEMRWQIGQLIGMILLSFIHMQPSFRVFSSSFAFDAV